MQVFETILIILLFCVIGYVFGNISFADIFGAVYHKDIHQLGSGNAGAANSYRSMGKKVGIMVFLCDMVKAYITVLVCALIYKGTIASWYSSALYLCGFLFLGGLFCIIGHCWTIKYIISLLKYKFNHNICRQFMGGKGVSTFVGVLWAFSPYIALLAMFAWIVVFLIWRYISIASTVLIVVAPLLTFAKDLDLVYLLLMFNQNVTSQTYGKAIWFIVVVFIILALAASLIALRHLSNYHRIANHTEPKFKFRNKK